MNDESSQNAFHITIGTIGSYTEKGLPDETFDSELRLIKASLLYADRVKFCSLKSAAIDKLERLPDLPVREKVDYFKLSLPRLFKFLPEEELKEHAEEIDQFSKLIDVLQHLNRKKHPNRDELLMRFKLESILHARISNGDFREVAEAVIKRSGISDIRRLIESGLLEHHRLEIRYYVRKEMVRLFNEFFNVLIEAISNGKTYPLFDDLTNTFIRRAITENEIGVQEANINRARQIQLAAFVMERLPSFDRASLDEILDIRKELERPLVRFRAAMMKFSQDVRSAPWDKEFEIDAEQVFHTEVEPAVLDIEDAVKTNSYLASLARKFTDRSLTLTAGSGLALLMSQLSALPHYVTQTLGVGAASAAMAYDAYKEWKEKELKAEQNHLFFYYRAAKQLEK